MPYFKKKKAEVPSWFRWAMLAFIAYIVFSHYLFGGGDDAEVTTEKTAQSVQEYDGSVVVPEEEQSPIAVIDALPERAKQTRERYYNAIFNPRALQDGGGDAQASNDAQAASKPAIARYPVLCGQTVSAKIRGSLSDGRSFDEGHDDKTAISFRVGSGEHRAAYDTLVAGLAKGESRKMRLPAKEVFAGEVETAVSDLQGDIVFFTEVTDIAPDLANSEPFVIHQLQTGTGTAATCGDTVGLRLARYDNQGKSQTLPVKKLFDIAPDAQGVVSHHLGSNAMGVAVDITAADMRIGEARIAVVPPELAGAAQEMLVLRIERVK